MKIITIIIRVLLGLVFVVFGSNAFLHFIPMPPPPADLAGDFMKSLFASNYFYVVAIVQILGGLLVLSGRFTALGLIFLCPVIVNILCYHTFLNHEGLPLALVVAALALFLLWQKRSNFAGVLRS